MLEKNNSIVNLHCFIYILVQKINSHTFPSGSNLKMKIVNFRKISHFKFFRKSNFTKNAVIFLKLGLTNAN